MVFIQNSTQNIIKFKLKRAGFSTRLSSDTENSNTSGLISEELGYAILYSFRFV